MPLITHLGTTLHRTTLKRHLATHSHTALLPLRAARSVPWLYPASNTAHATHATAQNIIRRAASGVLNTAGPEQRTRHLRFTARGEGSNGLVAQGLGPTAARVLGVIEALTERGAPTAVRDEVARQFRVFHGTDRSCNHHKGHNCHAEGHPFLQHFFSVKSLRKKGRCLRIVVLKAFFFNCKKNVSKGLIHLHRFLDGFFPWIATILSMPSLWTACCNRKLRRTSSIVLRRSATCCRRSVTCSC